MLSRAVSGVLYFAACLVFPSATVPSQLVAKDIYPGDQHLWSRSIGQHLSNFESILHPSISPVDDEHSCSVVVVHGYVCIG